VPGAFDNNNPATAPDAMLTHAISTAALTLAVAGVLFQVATLARLSACVARAQVIRWRRLRAPQRGGPSVPAPAKNPATKRRPRRDYRLALRRGQSAVTAR
jgi:hypothetical protein